MDGVGWLVIAAAIVLTLVAVILAPRLKRDAFQRQLDGGGGSLSGVGMGLDAVWRPTAEESRATWEAQVELPAPAPSPGDRGGIDDDRIVIEVDSRR